MDSVPTSTTGPRDLQEFVQSLPKIDLHRHLEGSLRFETVRELARRNELGLPSTGQLRTLVQIQEDEPLNFENFLSKFSTLRLLYRSPEVIGRIIREAIQDAAADNLRYLELRFTPVALSKAQGFPLSRVIDWVVESARSGEQEFGVTTRLIVSVNRHESPPLAAQVSYLAIERQEDGVVGLDLAGNEADFPAELFTHIFQNARRKGLHVTVHAGEWGEGNNVAQALEAFEAERIGHGIHILQSPNSLKKALQAGAVFEVCLTSNYQSGALAPDEPHPLPQMLAAGLKVTLNSDDPSVSGIDLSHEYRFALEKLGLSLEQLRACILTAASSAFLPPEQRQTLLQRLSAEFPQSYPDPAAR